MLKELTKRYEHLIRGYGIDKWGAKDFDGKEFIKGLTSIQSCLYVKDFGKAAETKCAV